MPGASHFGTAPLVAALLECFPSHCAADKTVFASLQASGVIVGWPNSVQSNPEVTVHSETFRLCQKWGCGRDALF